MTNEACGIWHRNTNLGYGLDLLFHNRLAFVFLRQSCLPGNKGSLESCSKGDCAESIGRYDEAARKVDSGEV